MKHASSGLRQIIANIYIADNNSHLQYTPKPSNAGPPASGTLPRTPRHSAPSFRLSRPPSIFPISVVEISPPISWVGVAIGRPEHRPPSHTEIARRLHAAFPANPKNPTQNWGPFFQRRFG